MYQQLFDNSRTIQCSRIIYTIFGNTKPYTFN